MIDVVVRLTVDGDAAVLDALRSWNPSALAARLSRMLAEAGPCAVSADVQVFESGRRAGEKEHRSNVERCSSERSAPDGIRVDEKLLSVD